MSAIAWSTLLAACERGPTSTQDAAVDVLAVDILAVDAPTDIAITDTPPARVTVSANFDLQAHRGGRALRPENTLPAFEHAIETGADTLETDLHLSRDGVVVVWHDPHISRSLCRVAPGATPPLPPDPDVLPAGDASLLIRAIDLAQLQKYRCDRNAAPTVFPGQNAAPGAIAGDDYRIASFAQFLDFVVAYAVNPAVDPALRQRAAGIRFNVETKREAAHPEYIGDDFDGTQPGLLERSIVSELRTRALVQRTTIESFEHRSLWAVHQLEPAITLSFLTSAVAVDFVDYAARGAQVWSPILLEVTAARVADAHASGLRVVPWTVNDASAVRRLVGLGVDGIITDDPVMALSVIQRP